MHQQQELFPPTPEDVDRVTEEIRDVVYDFQWAAEWLEWITAQGFALRDEQIDLDGIRERALMIGRTYELEREIFGVRVSWFCKVTSVRRSTSGFRVAFYEPGTMRRHTMALDTFNRKIVRVAGWTF